MARRTLKGPAPDTDDPTAILVSAAGRMPRNAQRPALTGPLAEQAAALALARVEHGHGPVARFDPGSLPVRERWETILDVLDADRRISAALGRHLHVDLLASPLPRMDIDDDRAVLAARRNRLPRATLAQLPVGRWVEVGPYTPDEWAARGEDASGKGAYLRLNSTAYLAVVERGDRATWRLEDTRARVGAGRLDGSDNADLDTAKTAALTTLKDRYPQLAAHAPDHASPAPAGTRTGWEPVPDQPGAMRHVHHGRVATYIVPAGDTWIPFLQRQSDQFPQPVGPAVTNREHALDTAEQAGRRAVREAVLDTRVDFDHAVAALAEGGDYSRDQLTALVSSRLAEPEQAALAQDPNPAELAELLGAAGVTAATTVAVLHAEGVTPADAGPLLPILGIPPVDAIGELHQRWGIGRLAAAALVDATAPEMRAAGCTPAEIIAARPRDVLTTLPAQPDLWDLAGGTLAAGGHPPDDIAAIAAAHAPNPDCFAAAMAAAIDDPATGIALAAQHDVTADALVALTERYGLSPAATADALAHAQVPTGLAVHVLHRRCDADPVLTTQIARSSLGVRTDLIVAALAEREPIDTTTVHQLRTAAALSRDHPALIAAHQPPAPTPKPRVAVDETRRLLAALPQPDPQKVPDGHDGYLAALPDPDENVPTTKSLLESLPEPDLALELTEIDR